MLFYDQGFFSKSFGKTVVENEEVMHVIHTMGNVKMEVAQCGATEGLKPYKLSGSSCSWICQGAR